MEKNRLNKEIKEVKEVNRSPTSNFRYLVSFFPFSWLYLLDLLDLFVKYSAPPH